MDAIEQQALIDEATYEHMMGESPKAVELLQKVTQANPESAAAWHALAEVYFSLEEYGMALEAGKAALAIHEEDVHLHTTLSRIYMELGDKATAETHGARTRVLGWKATLSGSEEEE